MLQSVSGKYIEEIDIYFCTLLLIASVFHHHSLEPAFGNG